MERRTKEEIKNEILLIQMRNSCMRSTLRQISPFSPRFIIQSMDKLTDDETGAVIVG